MNKFLMYIKRGIKYIIKDYKQPIIKVNIIQKESNELFKDRVYLITGGGSGIGYYIAKKLIGEGAKVIITGRNEEKLKNAKTNLGDFCDYLVYDINEFDKANNVINEIYNKFGRIDGIVNNAGISLHEWDFLKVTPEGFDTQFYTNLKGSYFLTQSYVKKMIDNKVEGNVIFISSERGSMAEVIPYGLSKASIDSLVKGLSYKYYKKGLRFNSVAPGVTASSMTNIRKESDLFSEATSGRYFVPEEVAEVVCYLLSDYSKSISGEIIHCNGGNHIKMGW